MISKALLLELLPFMNGFVDAKELSSRLSIAYDSCIDALEALIGLGIGKACSDDLFLFNASDRLDALLLALRLNASIEEVASILNWKDFEAFTASILEENAYEVAKNVRIRQGKHSVEIDVVGTKYINGKDIALTIDCKHWSYITEARLKGVVERQVMRAYMLISLYKMDAAIPIIIILRDMPMLIDGVPIVPISRLRSFLYEYDISSERLRVIRA